MLLACDAPFNNKADNKPVVKPIVLHDGKPGFAVSCGGSRFVDCEEVKGQICPNGYQESNHDSYRTDFIIRCHEKEK